MTEQPQTSFEMQADEKATPVMVYTSFGLSWGKLVTKENLMASRFLVGAAVPDYVSLFESNHMDSAGGQLFKPKKYAELHIPVQKISAFHLMPPNEEPLDYDPDEPNRIMKAVNIFVGDFVFKAQARISNQTSLKHTLDVTKSDFVSYYDAEIVHGKNSNMKAIRSPMVLVRRTSVVIAVE